MSSFEEVVRFGFSVSNELAAGVKTTPCVSTPRIVYLQPSTAVHNFLDLVGTQDAMFHVLWLEVALFDEELKINVLEHTPENDVRREYELTTG